MADARIGMQINKRINVEADYSWRSCKRVVFEGDTAAWELNTASYDLLAAYQKAPHLQLMQATDDNALRSFVKQWGPLRFTLDNLWSGADPIENYRIERDKLTLSARLLHSVSEPSSQRHVLLELWRLSGRDQTTGALLANIRTRIPIPGNVRHNLDPNIRHWVETATQAEIEAAVLVLVPASSPSVVMPSFLVERSKRGNSVRASLGITSLIQALAWMVWQDIFLKRPIQICEECRRPFQPEYQHKRKFCDEVCARRKASREFERRKRSKEKRANGTQKAR
jgi:hypothetical protein